MRRLLLHHLHRTAWLAAFVVTRLLAPAAESQHTFVIGDKDFLMDGKPYVIRSGELHYARIPREYWPHRLRMAKALGLNAVSTYVFWNLHEPQPGQFDFTGNADVAEFCRAAQRERLYVIVRPGPYVCGEWEMGGLPWWLLKDPQMRLRTRHPGFLEPARRYLAAVGRELAPLQITRGGPIIMVQVENEYLGYGRDGRYFEALRDALRAAPSHAQIGAGAFSREECEGREGQTCRAWTWTSPTSPPWRDTSVGASLRRLLQFSAEAPGSVRGWRSNRRKRRKRRGLGWPRWLLVELRAACFSVFSARKLLN